MEPALFTEDYYLVLEVDRSTDTAAIVKSYKKLARLLHPDRNNDQNATEAFQLVSCVGLQPTTSLFYLLLSSTRGFYCSLERYQASLVMV